MSANLAVPSASVRLQHASEADYAAFLSVSPSIRGDQALKARRRFVRAYPNLSTWFSAPLVERVGSVSPRAGRAYICAHSRAYLYFLAFEQRLRLDWPWILAINFHKLPPKLLPEPVNTYVDSLSAQAVQLGYGTIASRERVRRLVKYLHLNEPGRAHLPSEAALANFEQALTTFGDHADRLMFFASQTAWQRAFAEHRQALFTLRTLLYHRHAIVSFPRRTVTCPRRKLHAPPRMAALLERYLVVRRAQQSRPKTIQKFDAYVRHFASWVVAAHPTVETFGDVTRDHVLAYAATLRTTPHADNAVVSIETKISRLSTLSVFFQDTAAWGWDDAPTYTLIGARDLPKRVARLPRYIPADELERLMLAIRDLACPYQRTALLVARWSGARRSEICNLDLHCLDAYADGTPRLRIPAGKTGTERLIPLHEEAAIAIRGLQALDTGARGFRGDWGEQETPRLFVRRGQKMTSGYLFEAPLAIVCAEAGLLDPNGRPRITAHRFRHTVGTELAEGGARLHTIMKMLGHTSTGMTLIYAHLTDATIREDYLKVLGPGAQLAGPLAATLRVGAMPRESIDWLKANFFRTELELGHCLRLPQEGPCECDLYLTCAKFVTTPEYAPRLRARRLRELGLVKEARAQGWAREVERHACIVRRIEHLLTDLGEPVGESYPSDEGHTR